MGAGAQQGEQWQVGAGAGGELLLFSPSFPRKAPQAGCVNSHGVHFLYVISARSYSKGAGSGGKAACQGPVDAPWDTGFRPGSRLQKFSSCNEPT